MDPDLSKIAVSLLSPNPRDPPAQPGCEICNYNEHDLTKPLEVWFVDAIKIYDSADVLLCPGCMIIREALITFGSDPVTPALSVRLEGTKLSTSANDPSNLESLDLDLFCFEEQSSPLRALSDATEVSGLIGSEKSLSQIQRWLDMCTSPSKAGDQEHVCPKNLESPLPSRLVEVSATGGDGEGTVRLVETRGQDGSYACLSHCWGSQFHTLRTLSRNYDEHKKEITLESLPKTFRDAVEVTRYLGIPYLWIDSLCIIQDDPNDWERESALMGSIYQNGRITIAASAGSNSSEGLFVDTSAYLSHELSAHDAENNLYHARARRLIEHGNWPLLQRGWVYQERLLSPRFVHFGHAEVVWECIEGSWCECGRSREGGYQDLSFLVGKKNIFNIWAVIKAPLLRPDDDAWFMLWSTLVETYSRLDLSFLGDLLPALSGAAKQMQLHRKSRYIAGMWEDTLMKDLLWETRDLQQPRPGVRHSPTWSWVIVAGGYANTKVRMYASGASYNTVKGYGQDHICPKFRWFTRLVQVSITPAGQDPTGQVKSGYIILSGPVLRATLRWPFGTDMQHDMYLNGQNSASGKFSFRFESDYSLRPGSDGHVPDGTTLYCLKIAAREKDEADKYSGGEGIILYLVLRCIDEENGLYERVGLLSYTLKEDNLDGWYTELEEMQTVKII
ncbi:heterokaryon incompatibility protein-domain-containing protein [Bisporella sp. PMI_857]|nr:heterokaryon incompatibility protein-domain-containing protein [Bisporella sp. PMI_857]